jgi:membrane protease YdiL (CAAX protease family)
VLEPAPEPASADHGRAILPAQRLGAAIEVLLCSGFPTQLLLIGLLTAAGMPMQSAPGRLSPLFVFTLSLLDTLLVVSLVFYFIRVHRESPRAMLLGHRSILREALFGILIVPALFLLILLVLALVLTFAPWLHNVERNPFEDMMQTRRDTLAFGIVVMIAGGLREEIQRGFILRRFEQYLGGGLVGVIVFSAMFGLGHVEQGIDAALATSLLGAAWGVIYLARRSIVAPMVSHAAFNLAQLVKYVTLAVR